MKISVIRTGIVNLPANEPLADAAANPQGKRPIVWVRVGTDDGAEGIGVAYFGGALTGTLRHAIDELGALLVGDDPSLSEAIHAKLKNAAGGSAGPGGIYHLALSALDIAMWDLKAKAVEQPLWRLLGGGRPTVPTYASGALMRELSLDRVVKAAATLKERGWKEMKTQLALPGHTTPAHRGRAHGQDPRGDRPRHQADVRHQPALAARAGGRYRPPRRGRRGRPVLARGRHHRR